MTREDIIRMAREAGELKCNCCLPYYEEVDIKGFEGFLKRFAALVAAHEREECAKIAFNARTYIQAAKDIRARGTNEVRNP